jgi:hypothetical protein
MVFGGVPAFVILDDEHGTLEGRQALQRGGATGLSLGWQGQDGRTKDEKENEAAHHLVLYLSTSSIIFFTSVSTARKLS